MKLATSLYLGGELVEADRADYSTSRELGAVCPFCKEAVFLAREHERQGVKVSSSWRHYKMSDRSAYCENRALTAEGKELLSQLQPEARGQRLKLFNNKFWEIYKFMKSFPQPLKKACLCFLDEPTLNHMVRHCHRLWDVNAIVRALPQKMLVSADDLKQHPLSENMSSQLIKSLAEDFNKSQTSILNHKICCEVVAWLGTKSAYPSFEKVTQLALLDCFQIFPHPVHSNQVANMVITSIVLTDWQKAIESVGDRVGARKLRGIGFGK